MPGTTALWALVALLAGGMAGWLLRREVVPASASQRSQATEPQATEPQATTQPRQQDLERELAQAQRVIAGLKGARPSFLASGPCAHPDDFGAIRGVDPLAQRMLNNLGVHRYNQLAALNAEDIAWVASRMEISPARIEDEDWAGQARSLAVLHGQSLIG